MDEYVKYLYIKNPEWRDIDPGDLTEQKALRKKLKCKPFKWFMSQVAFDVPYYFPMTEYKPFASGQIHPLGEPDLCVTAKNGDSWERLALMPCNGDFKQFFELSWYRDVRQEEFFMCWDVPDTKARSPVVLLGCHQGGGNQVWRYHDVNKTLMHSEENNCFDYDPKSLELFINPCITDPLLAKTQKWIIDTVNKDNTAKWEEVSAITGPIEWKEDKRK